MSTPQLVCAGTALAPLAWTNFARAYPEEAIASAAPPVAYSPAKFAELARIHAHVNAGIDPRPPFGDAAEPWQILPVFATPRASGCCKDFAVTKRALLGRLGWPASSLLLAATELPGGARHLVLVARTSTGDFVLDSRLAGPPRLWWVEADLGWLILQSPADPNVWLQVAANG